MTLSTTNQAYIFLATVYLGLILGIIYDIYRAFRMVAKPGKWLVAILDLSFWILAAFISFFMLFKVNGGQIRLYAYIGLALGWGLYALIIGSFLVKLLVKIYSWIAAIILWPLRMISSGIKWLAQKLSIRKKIKERAKEKANNGL
ncbi:MAG: spore cortex biosynthesis protein YabQ [Clostridiales bacterium]|nr:spore cortex biosynthesis protein YabQ [Clostridiales bacterium]